MVRLLLWSIVGWSLCGIVYAVKEGRGSDASLELVVLLVALMILL